MDKIDSLLLEEQKLLDETKAILIKLMTCHKSIVQEMMKSDRQASREELYHDIKWTYGAFIIRYKKCLQNIEKSFAILSDFRFPKYISIEDLIKERVEYLSRKSKV
jgi:hypothetical protein